MSNQQTPLNGFEVIKGFQVYYEMFVGNRHCYKYQPQGKPVIIVTGNTKEEAKEKMINELSKQNS